MSRTKHFFYNSLSTALLQLLTLVAGFIVPKTMLVYYGSEINGLISSILQFIAYFNLVEAGLSGAAIYALYKPLAENDHGSISSIVSAAKRFYTQSGYFFLIFTTALAFLYPLCIKSSSLSRTEISLLVFILGVNGCLEFFTLAKYRVILTAAQKTYIVSFASIVHVIVNTVIVVVLSRNGATIVVLRIVALLSIFIRSAILMTYCKYKYKFLDYKAEPNNSSLNKRWDVLFLQILGAIHIGAPVIIITLILKDLKAVSVYSIFNMVLGGVSGILGIFVSGLAASFGDVIAKNETNILQKASAEFEFVYYSIITVAYSVTLITIMPFIRLFTKGVTDVNYNVPLIGFLFVLNSLLYSIKTPQGMLVISAGLYRETRWQTATQGLIAVVTGVLLAPFWGIAGVLAGSILSNLYRDIDLLFFIPRNLTKLPVRSTFYRQIRIFASSVIIVLPFYIKLDIALNSYLEWIMLAMLSTGYAITVVVITSFIFDRTVSKNVMARFNSLRGAVK
ncbi:MAG: hypothetical protein VB076_01050 [Synergistaceae bacterium]|nr:hypothetical protein [Synergistaceae bacterium]